jgi:hypothetical protein
MVKRLSSKSQKLITNNALVTKILIPPGKRYCHLMYADAYSYKQFKCLVILSK